MKWIIIFYILTSVYFIFNRNRILSPVGQRIYRYKFVIFLDIVYFLSILLYPVFLVSMIFSGYMYFYILIIFLLMSMIFRYVKFDNVIIDEFKLLLLVMMYCIYN